MRREHLECLVPPGNLTDQRGRHSLCLYARLPHHRFAADDGCSLQLLLAACHSGSRQGAYVSNLDRFVKFEHKGIGRIAAKP
jgi:hypothetical protein